MESGALLLFQPVSTQRGHNGTHNSVAVLPDPIASSMPKYRRL